MLSLSRLLSVASVVVFVVVIVVLVVIVVVVVIGHVFSCVKEGKGARESWRREIWREREA